MSILSVKNLEKKFGDLTVLKNISFNINDGEIISIIGSSGSGKSTLLRCMNQLETITSGTITIDGKTLVETKNGAPVYAGKDILKERKKVVPIEEFPELIHEDHYFTNEWRKILSNLNGKYQIVMELYYVDGFSTKEIARMLHITEVNVRSRMVRGRKQLEQILTARAMD